MLVTSLYLGGVGAEGRTKWLEEESRLVHLFVRVWFEVEQVEREFVA